MPAVGRFSGTPASISASDEPHTVAIEDEPFELGDLRHDADRIGEFRCGRQHWADRAPGELAVADFAPAGRTHASRLADGIGWEVVVEQEAFLVGAVERVDVLLVLARPERRDDERLRLAAREQGRAVRTREDPDLRQDRADGLQVAAVDAALVVEDVPAHHLRLGVVERFGHFGVGELGLAALRSKGGHDFRLDGVDGGVALLLLGDRIGGAQIRFGDLEHGLLDRGAIARGQIARILGGLFSEPDDRLDDRLEAGVAGHDRFQHDLLGQLLGFRFDHQNRVRRPGDDEVEGRVLHLFDRRVEPDLALDEAHAGRPDRPHERHAGKGERRGGGDHRQDVGIRLEVIGEHRRDDLGLAAELVGEQRADRPIDETRSERLAVGRASFAFQVAARNAPRRERLLLIMDGEGEKILSGLGLLQRHDRREHRGFTPRGVHGAVGLTRHPAGLQHKLAPAPVEFFALNVKHLSSSCG